MTQRSELLAALAPIVALQPAKASNPLQDTVIIGPDSVYGSGISTYASMAIEGGPKDHVRVKTADLVNRISAMKSSEIKLASRSSKNGPILEIKGNVVTRMQTIDILEGLSMSLPDADHKLDGGVFVRALSKVAFACHEDPMTATSAIIVDDGYAIGTDGRYGAIVQIPKLPACGVTKTFLKAISSLAACDWRVGVSPSQIVVRCADDTVASGVLAAALPAKIVVDRVMAPLPHSFRVKRSSLTDVLGSMKEMSRELARDRVVVTMSEGKIALDMMDGAAEAEIDAETTGSAQFGLSAKRFLKMLGMFRGDTIDVEFGAETDIVRVRDLADSECTDIGFAAQMLEKVSEAA